MTEETAITPPGGVATRNWGDTFEAALVSATILLIPFTSHVLLHLETHSPHLSGGHLQSTYLTPTDILLAVAAIIGVYRLATDSRSRSIVVVGPLLLVVLGSAHVATDPTAHGLLMVLRLLGGIGIVALILRMARERFTTAVVGCLAILASIEGALALAQTVLGVGKARPDAASSAGRVWTAGLGSFGHEYVLAAFLTLAIAAALAIASTRSRTAAWLAAAAIAAAGVSTSYGRTAGLAVLIVSGAYAIAWIRRRTRPLLLASAVPAASFLAGVACFSADWTARVESGSTIRIELARRAMDVIRIDPVFGVGPVEYGRSLARLGLQSIDTYTVHNVPLLVSAEYGVPAGILFVCWLVWTGALALRRSVQATAVFLAPIPFLLLDNLHFVYPEGLAMLALWLGILGYLVQISRGDTSPTTADVTSAN